MLLLGLLLGIMIIGLHGPSAAADENHTPAPPTIRSGAEVDYPPFSIVDAGGRAGGFSVELLQAALAAMNRQVTFRTGVWAEVRGWLEKGEIDALPLVGRTPEREAIYDFTFPYMSLHGAIVVREGIRGINGLEDLRGRKVAVMRGDNVEEFLRREDRGIHIHPTSSFEVALRELSQGLHDAVVIQRLVALRMIQETGLSNLKIIDKPVEDYRQDFCFAVRAGDRKTLALLNEGLSLVMADGTYRHLHAKWFAALELPTNRRIVIGGDRNFPPYEYLDENGRPAGYNVDLTKAIAREVGLDIEIRLGPWMEIRKALERGEIDALQGMFYSRERNLKFDFSTPHIVSHCIAVVRKGEGPPPDRIEALKGKRIVVEQGDIMHDFVLENGLEDRVAVADTQYDALWELVQGKHDCALVSRLTAHHFIQKYAWNTLVVGKRPLLSLGYGYATLRGHKALLAQIGEGLKVLDETGAYRRIYEKWMGVYEDPPPKILTVLRHIAIAAIPLVGLLCIVVLWSWSLRKEVARKTRELQESIDQFRFVFESANVGKSMTLPTGELHPNQALADMLGYPRDELKGKRWQELTPPEDLESIEKCIAPMLSGQTDNIRFEKRYVGKSGALFWADVSAAARKDAAGRLLYFVTNVVDITDRKISELRIQHLNQVLRSLRGVNQLIVRVHDPESLIREGCRLLVENRGYRSAMIVLTDAENRPVSWAMAGTAEECRELSTLLGEGRLPPCCRSAKGMQQVLFCQDDENKVGECPIAAYCSDIQTFFLPLIHEGERFGYLSAASENSLVMDEEEKGLFFEMARDFAYALSVMRLEAERMRGVAALQESESRFRLFAELAPVGIVISDAQERTLYVSSKFTELFGYTLEDIPSVMEWWALAHPDPTSRSRVRRDWESRQEFVPVDYPVTCKDGRVRQVELRFASSSRLNVVVFTDITERRHSEQERERLQAQLIQAQKMESVGRLAGGVAHDYNNMLGVIIGHAELAMEETPAEAPLYADLREILNAATRSADITRQLLAFARRQTIHPEVLDLNAAVGKTLNMLQRLIGEDIDLSWRPGDRLWSVSMDPTQLDQILANLCVNARDAIGGVGKITIETDNVFLDADYCEKHAGFTAGDFVRLAVSDDGCGMDPQTLGNIFEPFFTTKGLGEGTGLGLAMVYGIVKQNKGFIHVYSEPGKGSTFRIYLPRHRGKAEDIEVHTEAEPRWGSGETVLLVEDEESILRLVKTMLEKMGYAVLDASSPSQAMNLAEVHTEQIRLLITDVVMPEMNGRDLADRLKSRHPDLRVLFMSGYTANVIAHRGVLEAGVHFIQKPFSRKNLAAKISEILTS